MWWSNRAACVPTIARHLGTKHGAHPHLACSLGEPHHAVQTVTIRERQCTQSTFVCHLDETLGR